MVRRHNKEGGNHLDHECNRQTTVEDTDGGLHPTVNGQSLDERQNKENTDRHVNSSFSSAFPARFLVLDLTILDEIFACVTFILNICCPTIMVVTLCLCG